MPLITAFNLSKEDRLPEMEVALREALVSMPSTWSRCSGRTTARAFQRVAGADRRVKVVIRPYEVGTSGWVSF